MFDAFLSCRVIGIPETREGEHVIIAQQWSGQRDLRPQSNGAVYWDDRTSIGTRLATSSGTYGQYPWFDPPPSAVVRMHHALIPLSRENGIIFCAFVSPLSGVTIAFKNAAEAYVHGDGHSAIVRFSLDLTTFARKSWRSMPEIVRVEGEGKDGLVHVITIGQSSREEARGSAIEGLNKLYSIEIESASRRTRVDDEFNIRIADVASDPDDVVTSLRDTFGLFRNYLRSDGQKVLSYN